MRPGVIGAGAFGTALAIVLASDGTRVTLWGRDADAMADAEAHRENAARLPGRHLPPTLEVTSNADALGDCDTVLLAVPAQKLSAVVEDLKGVLGGKSLIACCKGIDLKTLQGPTAVMARACTDAETAVLTGPSFADEIAAGLPTALTLASANRDVAGELQMALSRDTLRLYASDDPVGAELGGALKNVIALAAGICIGAGYGDSARAAVIARGFAEMLRVADALGGRSETLTGLSGLGDLVLTAMSEKSRNMRAGQSLGRGEGLPANMTVEGAATAEAVCRIADDLGIGVPLSRAVGEIVTGDLSVRDARDLLLSRPLTEE